MIAFNAACDFAAGEAWTAKQFHRWDIHRVAYRGIRERFRLPAQLAAHAIAKVSACYQRDRTKRPEFRPLGAVTYDSRVLRLLNLSVVSVSTLSGRIRVNLGIGGYQRDRLKAAIFGETKLLFHRDRGTWSFVFTVKSEPPPVSEPTGFLGVDLGVKNVAVDSDGTFYTGGQVRGLRRRHLRLRQRLQAKGTKSAKRLLKKRRLRERRYQRWVNHNISKQIVARAQCTGRGLAVEDLLHIRTRIKARKQHRATLSAWAFGQLRFHLAYKAQDAGVSLVAVDPRGTSRTCPACGHCEKGNRRSQADFQCLQCGCSGHADAFAAENIRRAALVSRPYAAPLGAAANATPL